MRVVLQRVASAQVRVAGVVTGRIDRGFTILAGFHLADTPDALHWMADRIIGLRLFPDDNAADPADPAGVAGTGTVSGDAATRASSFSRDIRAVNGAVLVVSQFTLYGDTRKGRRPSFIDAAPPSAAGPLYEQFVALLRERLPGRVETGVFGAMMQVELVNDGPVTLILER